MSQSVRVLRRLPLPLPLLLLPLLSVAVPAHARSEGAGPTVGFIIEHLDYKAPFLFFSLLLLCFFSLTSGLEEKKNLTPCLGLQRM